MQSGTESGTWYGVANRTAVDDVIPPSPPGRNHTDTLARASTSLPFEAAPSSVSWWGMLTVSEHKASMNPDRRSILNLQVSATDVVHRADPGYYHGRRPYHRDRIHPPHM